MLIMQNINHSGFSSQQDIQVILLKELLANSSLEEVRRICHEKVQEQLFQQYSLLKEIPVEKQLSIDFTLECTKRTIEKLRLEELICITINIQKQILASENIIKAAKGL